MYNILNTIQNKTLHAHDIVTCKKKYVYKEQTIAKTAKTETV